MANSSTVILTGLEAIQPGPQPPSKKKEKGDGTLPDSSSRTDVDEEHDLAVDGTRCEMCPNVNDVMVKRFGSDSLLEEPLQLLFARDLTHRYWLVPRVHSSPVVDEGARPWPRGSRRGSDGAAKNYLDHSSSPLLFLAKYG